MSRPKTGDYTSHYETYIRLAEGTTVQALIENHSTALNAFISSLPEDKADYRYASDKWTIKDVVQHLIDAERIFTYRALRFARKDKTPVPGFEENDYAANADTAKRSLKQLQEEFIAVRRSTDLFLLSLEEEQLQQSGEANGKSITVNALVFVIFGHILHHKKVLEERYF